MLSKTIRPLAVALMLGAAFSASAAQRTFVSTLGSDANTASNCSRTLPCRGFAAALTTTDVGGEIVVLDSGGYGPVTINKSVSIIAPEGVYAGISVFSGTGITIGTAGINVVLRGLSINSLGGDYGISMTNGDSLLVENCVVSSFSTTSGAGINVYAAAQVTVAQSIFRGNYFGASFSGGAKARLSDSKFLRNASSGMYVNSDATGTTQASVERTVSSGNGGVGFEANATAGKTYLAIRNSVATENSSYGLLAYASSAGATVASASDSVLSHNGTAGAYSNGSDTRMVVNNNLITRNGFYGLYQAGSGVLVSTGGNTVSENGTAASGGIITSLAKM